MKAPPPGTCPSHSPLDYRPRHARAKSTGTAVGFHLSHHPEPDWVRHPVVAFRAFQRDRTVGSSSRSGCTSAPDRASYLPTGRSCAARRAQPLTAGLALRQFRSDAWHLARLAPPARSKTLDVPPLLTRSTAYRRPDIRAGRASGNGEPEVGLPTH